MIVTNRMQLWVSTPIVYIPEGTEKTLDGIAWVVGIGVWGLFFFIIIRAIVLNTRDRRARRRRLPKVKNLSDLYPRGKA